MKKIFLIIAIITVFFLTALAVALTTRVGVDYITALIIAEQNDHYYKMRQYIDELKHVTQKMGGFVTTLQKRPLTRDEKKEVRAQLRFMEEVALKISREIGFYDEDTTVHIFFEPPHRIVTYFAHTHDTPLYIDRFVRSMEEGLFDNYLTHNQKTTIMENFELLKKEIENL